MKYFLDTEFHEFKKKPLFGKAIDTIELISIGIASEDEREYYAICKDFDLKAAWDNEWLREHVLVNIYTDLVHGDMRNHFSFSYNTMKGLVKSHGKTKEQIADEVHMFCSGGYFEGTGLSYDERIKYKINPELAPEFCAYYADYDWVVFCWLFGRMIDLPKGFPMYCKDLKQLVDEHFKINRDLNEYVESCIDCNSSCTLEDLKNIFHEKLNLPKQESTEHNALADAKWNKKIYEFLKYL